MIQEFIKIYGTKEEPGTLDNPVILGWAKELGIKDYHHDEVPWCGLAMALIAKRANKTYDFPPLWAKNWAKFGRKVTDGAMLGDVLVFSRQGGGHVGLYIAEDEKNYHVGGGNQLDQVNIVMIAKSRIYAIRRPDYKVTPPNVRKIIVNQDGELSKNEQ